jgi:hypothetical protein
MEEKVEDILYYVSNVKSYVIERDFSIQSRTNQSFVDYCNSEIHKNIDYIMEEVLRNKELMKETLEDKFFGEILVNSEEENKIFMCKYINRLFEEHNINMEIY